MELFSDNITTGVDNIHNMHKMGVYFLDNTCPICMNTMDLVGEKYQKLKINMFYHCKNCNFISPITHEVFGDGISPDYINSKYFMDHFGVKGNIDEHAKRNILERVKIMEIKGII